jgi:methionyl-tRNA formyltransferase
MSNSHPRVLFFGMEGVFSVPVLQILLEQQFDICALILPISPLAAKIASPIQRREPPLTRRTQLPLLSAHPSLLQLAHSHHIPVWEIQHLSHPQTFSTLSAYQPDILCVACFSQRIPDALFSLPRLAALNVHPSLLPANRGPVPLFWTFRDGDSLTGVTIHALESTLDTGDIFAQTSFPVPDGISYNQLETLAAQQGGTLLAQTIARLSSGDALRTPQDPAKSSYHSFPNPEDFIVQAELWPARHVYNFIQGVGRWGGPALIHTGPYSFSTTHALSYSTSLAGEKPEPSTDPIFYQDGLAWIRCLDGWVQLSIIS